MSHQRWGCQLFLTFLWKGITYSGGSARSKTGLPHSFLAHASVCQGRICSDDLTCCYTEMDVDRTFYLTQSQYIGTGPTSLSATDPATPGAWQFVCLLVGCLTSQQQASVSQGRICSDNFTCCHTEIEVADQTFYLTQSVYTDTGPTSPSADPITPGAWQGNHWSANF